MFPSLLVLATTNTNVALVVFAAIGAPIILVFMSGLVEFVTSWSNKGRSKDQLIIWTAEESNSREWRRETGNIEKLVSLHGNRNIADVERVVRFHLAHFSSLGLDLVTGAFAIDVASLIENKGAPTYLGIAVMLQVVMLMAVISAMQVNQSSHPNQHWWGRLSALSAIFFGLIAMIISFLALDEGVVNTLLTNLEGGQ